MQISSVNPALPNLLQIKYHSKKNIITFCKLLAIPIDYSHHPKILSSIRIFPFYLACKKDLCYLVSGYQEDFSP